MTEGKHNSNLKLAFKAHLSDAVITKHADRFTGAVPDFSVTWHGVTSWVEVKFYNEGDFDSPPTQHLNCRQLARQGLCYYVIFSLSKNQKTTHMVHPEELHQWRAAPDMTVGYNYQWVAQRLGVLHAHHRQKR